MGSRKRGECEKTDKRSSHIVVNAAEHNSRGGEEASSMNVEGAFILPTRRREFTDNYGISEWLELHIGKERGTQPTSPCTLRQVCNCE